MHRALLLDPDFVAKVKWHKQSSLIAAAAKMNRLQFLYDRWSDPAQLESDLTVAIEEDWSDLQCVTHAFMYNTPVGAWKDGDVKFCGHGVVWDDAPKEEVEANVPPEFVMVVDEDEGKNDGDQEMGGTSGNVDKGRLAVPKVEEQGNGRSSGSHTSVSFAPEAERRDSDITQPTQASSSGIGSLLKRKIRRGKSDSTAP